MDSDEENTKSQMMVDQTEPKSPTHKRKKKKKNYKKTNKKQAVESVQATIKVFQDHPDKASPLVGYFPSGFDPKDNCQSGSAKAKVFRNVEKPRRLQLVVTPGGSKMDFVGTNYAGEAEAGQQHCNYAIGVLDKDTQTLKIVPIASNKIFRLEPKIRGLDYSNKEPENSAVEEELSARKTNLEMRDELVSRFGSKKSRKQDMEIKSLRQVEDAESLKDLEGRINEIVVNKDALESTDAHVTRNIPPHNTAATSPEEAYPLGKIIFKGEWSFLQDLYKLLQEGMEVSPNAYPTFISNRIYKLRDIQDEEEKKKLSCIFSYITHLIKFKDLRSLDGFKSAKGHTFPSILRQRFSNMFGEDKNMPPEKRGLLISYVLVLTLHADDFRTDFSDVAKDLKMSSIQLRSHYEHLGCKISRQNSISFATLPVPLQFPQTRQKRRRR